MCIKLFIVLLLQLLYFKYLLDLVKVTPFVWPESYIFSNERAYNTPPSPFLFIFPRLLILCVLYKFYLLIVFVAFCI